MSAKVGNIKPVNIKNAFLTSFMAMCAVVGGSFTSFASNFNPSANPQWTGGNTAPIDPECNSDPIIFTAQQAPLQWRIDYMCSPSNNALERYLTADYGVNTINSTCTCYSSSSNAYCYNVLHSGDSWYNGNTYNGYRNNYCWAGGDSSTWDLVSKCWDSNTNTVKSTCDSISVSGYSVNTSVGLTQANPNKFYECTQTQGNYRSCERPHVFDSIGTDPTVTVTRNCRAGRTYCDPQTISNYQATVEYYYSICEDTMWATTNQWLNSEPAAWLCAVYDPDSTHLRGMNGTAAITVGNVEYVTLPIDASFYGVVAADDCSTNYTLTRSFPENVFAVCNDSGISTTGTYKKHYSLICMPGLHQFMSKNILFDYDGGHVGNSNDTSTNVTVRVNSGIDAPVTPPSKTGYTFKHWELKTNY